MKTLRDIQSQHVRLRHRPTSSRHPYMPSAYKRRNRYPKQLVFRFAAKLNISGVNLFLTASEVFHSALTMPCTFCRFLKLAAWALLSCGSVGQNNETKLTATHRRNEFAIKTCAQTHHCYMCMCTHTVVLLLQHLGGYGWAL